MQCSSCGKTLLLSTTVCPMCKTPVPNTGSAQADDEYTEYTGSFINLSRLLKHRKHSSMYNHLLQHKKRR